MIISLSVGRALTYLWIALISWTPLNMDTSMSAFSCELWMIISSYFWILNVADEAWQKWPPLVRPPTKSDLDKTHIVDHFPAGTLTINYSSNLHNIKLQQTNLFPSIWINLLQWSLEPEVDLLLQWWPAEHRRQVQEGADCVSELHGSYLWSENYAELFSNLNFVVLCLL